MDFSFNVKPMKRLLTQYDDEIENNQDIQFLLLVTYLWISKRIKCRTSIRRLGVAVSVFPYNVDYMLLEWN